MHIAAFHLLRCVSSNPTPTPDLCRLFAISSVVHVTVRSFIRVWCKILIYCCEKFNFFGQRTQERSSVGILVLKVTIAAYIYCDWSSILLCVKVTEN